MTIEVSLLVEPLSTTPFDAVFVRRAFERVNSFMLPLVYCQVPGSGETLWAIGAFDELSRMCSEVLRQDSRPGEVSGADMAPMS